MEKVWNKTKEELQKEISENDFATWIKPISFIKCENDTLTLEAESNFYIKWFIDNYFEKTKQILQNIAGREIGISLSVSKSSAMSQMDFGSKILGQKKDDETTYTSNKRIKGHAPNFPPNGLNPIYNFANFIEGPSNQLARAACLSVAKKPGKSFNPLFLYGGTGLGKTHLINAIGNYINLKRQGMKVVAISSEKFMNEMINAIHHNRVNSFRNKYRHCDCLMIDDIQFLARKERTQEEFFHTFNTLHESGSQIVLTSDRMPKEIPDIEDRLRTRFGWGLVADIQPPELETRLAILREKAQQNNVTLPDDVAFFLADKFVDNVRDLEGAFIRLSAYSSFNGGTISLDMAKAVLRNMINDEEKVVTIDMVQRKVCEYFKVKLSDMKSQRRQRIIAVPRQIGMYLSRKLTESSFPCIGQQFGGRDHSTVIHACNKIEKQCDSDNTLLKTVKSIEKTIRK